MVETITPVVHGGRRSRWAAFLATHVAGAAAAAAAFGAVLGGAGGLLGAPWGAAGVVLVATLAGLYLAREALGVPVPVPQLRRQVPDWWRTFFPFGPASFLYGLGLGVGFLTYLSRGTLVAVAAAAVASGRPLDGAILMAPFGVVRGLTSIVAARARTPEEGSALVDRLARSASWAGWRLAHVAALTGVVVAAGAEAIGRGRPSDPGGAAAAVVSVAFGAAAVWKLARFGAWRRALRRYGLPAVLEGPALVGVPVAEAATAALPFLGLPSTAGMVALASLSAFSVAIVAARVRTGRRLACGCFGAAAERDYRALLARNAVLATAAAVAWRSGTDAPVLGWPGAPSGLEVLPAAFVAAAGVLAVWTIAQAVVAVRRGSTR